MFSTWDLVRPAFWHPMTMIEHSMMDLDMTASQMVNSRFPLTQSMLSTPSTREDDDFFRDLPVTERDQEVPGTQPEAQRESTRAFSSYSFSNSSVVDDKGRRITSTRRRYEDSTGRLKATHEREVNGRRVKSIWTRANKDDQGEHKTICSDGDAEEFEQLWKQTPFGSAQEKKMKELETKGGEVAHGEAQKGKKQQGGPESMLKHASQGQQQEQSQPMEP